MVYLSEKEEKKLYDLSLDHIAKSNWDCLLFCKEDYSELVLKHIFNNSKEIKIFDNNLENKMWEGEEIFNAFRYWDYNEKDMKILLNNYPCESKISKLVEREKIFLGNIEMKKTNTILTEKKDESESPIYFVIGDNKRFLFHRNKKIAYSFNDKEYSKKLIEQFDSIFSEATKL